MKQPYQTEEDKISLIKIGNLMRNLKKERLNAKILP